MYLNSTWVQYGVQILCQWSFKKVEEVVTLEVKEETQVQNTEEVKDEVQN